MHAIYQGLDDPQGHRQGEAGVGDEGGVGNLFFWGPVPLLKARHIYFVAVFIDDIKRSGRLRASIYAVRPLSRRRLLCQLPLLFQPFG